MSRFYCVRQPKWRSGYKIGVIVLKHWNADSKKYFRGVNWIRRILTPVSTAIFIPTYPDLSPKAESQRQHNILGSNIGLTIRRVWQDVLDIQYFANYLKETKGFEKIGLFAYSIGSLRALLATIFAPELFDVPLFHFLADDFTEAFMDGIATTDEAAVVDKNISRGDLKKIWSTISAGNYEKYLSRLPKHTRLVQAKYDMVFGENNCARMTKLIRKRSPFVEIEEGNFGHVTVAEVEKTVLLMLRDLSFVYRGSGLRYF